MPSYGTTETVLESPPRIYDPPSRPMLRSRPRCSSAFATDEREELRLRSHTGGHENVLAKHPTGSHHVGLILEEPVGGVHQFGIEGGILARGGCQVPSVNQDINETV